MTPTELQQFLRDKLRKAYSLGQTWWQQADSEYRRENKKADETAAKFAELVENVVLAVTFELNRAGATEAAKATGTAWEQKPIAYAVYSCAGIHRLHSVKPIVDDEWRADDDCLGEYWAGNEPLYAEAARQPAPVAIKTWQESVGYPANALPPNRIERAMAQEIADLRAALAARSQP